MENIKECILRLILVWASCNGLRSEGPGFVLKAGASKLFLLCCVFSEIVRVSEIPEGRAHFFLIKSLKAVSYHLLNIASK